MGRSLRVEADGGSRGNPGVAGYGALVRDRATGRLLVEVAAPVGTASNNVAEYRGMLAGLGAAHEIDPGADVEVVMDSKLVVEQMSGRWKIKHPDMRQLAQRGRDLVAQLTQAGGSVTFTWVPREDNTDADALSNRGMDGEEVAHWHHAGQPQHDRDAPTRVVLVREGSPTQTERTAPQVRALVADAQVDLIVPDPDGHTPTSLAAALDVEPRSDAVWGGPSRTSTSPDEWAEQVVTAWQRVLAEGGTTVIVGAHTPILLVLVHVLGMPRARMRRLAVDPGSLTAIEVRTDGEAVVAFTNRT